MPRCEHIRQIVPDGWLPCAWPGCPNGTENVTWAIAREIRIDSFIGGDEPEEGIIDIETYHRIQRTWDDGFIEWRWAMKEEEI